MNEKQILNFLRNNDYLREASVPVCSKKIEKILGHFLREQDIIQYKKMAYLSDLGARTEATTSTVTHVMPMAYKDYENL